MLVWGYGDIEGYTKAIAAEYGSNLETFEASYSTLDLLQ